MLYNDGDFLFGADWLILKQMNYDHTHAVPTRIVGGAGPFDFSGVAAPAAVPITIKINGETPVTALIDLTGVVDISAVTVAELVILLTAAGFADIAFATEAVTGYLHVSYAGTDTCNYLQVYGELAEIALIGQGQGVRFAVSDSSQEFKYAPKNKDAEEFPITNTRGQTALVRTRTLRMGGTGSWIDTPRDKWMMHVVENGIIDLTANTYISPTQSTPPILFTIEAFTRIYGDGENPEANIRAIERRILYQCDGTIQENTLNRGLNGNAYNYTSAAYTDETGAECGDSFQEEMTIAAYEALDLENLITY